VTFTTASRAHLDRSERDVALRSVLHWHAGKAWVYGAVVMPDHVHLLIQPSADEQLSRLLHSIKSFSAHEIARAHGTSGSVWQDESMDRVVRNDYEFAQKLRYICRNPLAKGLATTDTPGRSDGGDTYPWLFVADRWPWQRRPVVLVELADDTDGACAREGTLRGDSVFCPCCRRSTPLSVVRQQLRERRSEPEKAGLVCVFTSGGEGDVGLGGEQARLLPH